MKRQQGASNNVAYTTEELFNMGKAQFTKIVSAFEHSMVGSAQEKLRQRSDLEAMVEQIEQETLQDQAHALLQSWQTADLACKLLEQQGCAAATAELQAACLAAKAAVEKVLSPETIEAQAKPSVSRVNVDRGKDEAAQADVARVDVDRAAEPLQQEFEVSFPEQDSAFVGSRPGSGRKTLESLLSEVQQRSLCVQGGGEIPCHFSTLTTAIYHWDDLAQCLEHQYGTKAAGRQSGSFGTSRTAVSAGTPASPPLPGRCRLVHGLQNGTVLQTRAEVRGWARCVRVGRRRNHALAFDQLWITHAPCRSNRSRDAAAR